MGNFIEHLTSSDEVILVGNFIEHFAGGVQIAIVRTESQVLG